MLIGMNFFGELKKGKYDAINEDANFGDGWSAMLTLVRAETGEGWNALMHDTMEDSGWVACIFWILYVSIKVQILLNLVVAVIF